MSTVNQQQAMQLLATDPQLQAIIQRVWGNTPVNQRPGDTPKNLEQANHRASEEIGRVLAQRGMQLPSHSFINPRTQSVEGEHGWAGLPTLAKVGIIGGAAAGGLGLAGALGAFGGAGAAGGAAAVPSLSVSEGLPAGLFGTAAGTAGTASTVGTAAAGAAKGAGFMSGFGIKDAVQLGPMLASLFMGKGGTPPQNDAMNGLINMQTQRLHDADPLYQAILKMAMGLMPSAYQGGGGTTTATRPGTPHTRLR